MPRKKNTVGGGNQTNINGLGFEQETTLADALSRKRKHRKTYSKESFV